jgi:hypothetical protein
MKRVLAGIGFIGFAALSLLHVVSLCRIGVYYGPGLHWIASSNFGLEEVQSRGADYRSTAKNGRHSAEHVLFSPLLLAEHSPG